MTNDYQKKGACSSADSLRLFYMLTQDVALKAVTMAVATDAMICTIHLKVSFFVIRF